MWAAVRPTYFFFDYLSRFFMTTRSKTRDESCRSTQRSVLKDEIDSMHFANAVTPPD